MNRLAEHFDAGGVREMEHKSNSRSGTGWPKPSARQCSPRSPRRSAWTNTRAISMVSDTANRFQEAPRRFQISFAKWPPDTPEVFFRRWVDAPRFGNPNISLNGLHPCKRHSRYATFVERCRLWSRPVLLRWSQLQARIRRAPHASGGGHLQARPSPVSPPVARSHHSPMSSDMCEGGDSSNYPAARASAAAP